MKYDLVHLPGPPVNGCGAYIVSVDLADDHERGDRIKLRCYRCGSYGEHEVLAPLEGLA